MLVVHCDRHIVAVEAAVDMYLPLHPLHVPSAPPFYCTTHSLAQRPS